MQLKVIKVVFRNYQQTIFSYLGRPGVIRSEPFILELETFANKLAAVVGAMVAGEISKKKVISGHKVDYFFLPSGPSLPDLSERLWTGFYSHHFPETSFLRIQRNNSWAKNLHNRLRKA